MFSTVDNNDPFIRLQFLSDDEMARQINRQSVFVAGPDRRVNHPEIMGGYRYPILEDIAKGNIFCICTSPLPTTPAQGDAYRRLLSDPDTLYAYVDSGRVFYVQVANPDKMSGVLGRNGWEATYTPGGKTPKRIKTLNRPFRWWTKFSDRKLHVHIIPDDAYADDLADKGFTAEEIESLLDGAFIISDKLIEKCRDNIRFLLPNDTTNPLLSIDHIRHYFYMKESADFVSFNARVFGPMAFSGDLSHAESIDGMIKGEAYKADLSKRKGFENCDIICAASAIKHEVFNDETCFVLVEPQTAKLSQGEIQVFSDMQTIANNPALFDPAQMKTFTADWVMDMLDHLKAGNLLSSWYTQSNIAFNDGKLYSATDVNTLTRWQARAWAMSGLNYTQSPWLFNHLASLMADSLRADDDRKMKFPVPAAMRVLVISASMARAFGWEEDVERGDIRFYGDMEALVVHDEDWIEMRPSHGGHDLDDFFVAYYREIDGVRKVILVRSPNDYGEYTIFNYVEGDYYPYWQRVNGNIIEFPEISSDPALWPQRLSEAIAEGKIIYTKLPSQLIPKPDVKPEPAQYTREHVDLQVRSAPNSTTSVGGNVNARTLYSLVIAPHEGHRPVQLCSMEQAIDAGTQSIVKEDTTAVLEEAAVIITEVQNAPYKVDMYMWNNRFASRYGALPTHRIDQQGRLTRLNQLRGDRAAAFKILANQWSQTHCRPDPIIHTLGMARFAQARQVLMTCRINMVQMQPSGSQSLMVEHWKIVHRPVFEVLEALDDDQHRYDFIIALWSAALKTPTSSGQRVTDQIVMNPDVFPLLLDALRFYGLANYITLTEEGSLTTYGVKEWDLACVSCDSTVHTTDPVMLQRYHLLGGVCRSCRDHAAVEVVAGE